jgi:predicted dehydrogenase
MNDIIKWGIIGLGNVAHGFAKSIDNAKNAKLTAIASKTTDKLSKFKNEFNINSNNCYDDYEKLLSSDEVDIVYITLPNTFHFHWIMQAIKKDKRILIEKPAFLNIEQAQIIKQKIEEKKIFFTEGFFYRYLPHISDMIKIINENEIGELISMESSFGLNLLTKKKLFFFKKKKKINSSGRLFNTKLGGGCILDLGCYPSSFSLLIASLIKNIDYKNFKMLDIKKDMGETGVDIDASAVIQFDGGFTSKIKSSFKNDVGSQSIIKGKKGSIKIHDTWFGDVIKKSIGDKTYELKKRSYAQVFLYEVESISEALSNNLKEVPSPGMSLEETLLNTKILEEWFNA